MHSDHFDRKVRVVNLDNLKAMLKYCSGRGVKFFLISKSKTRVHVGCTATYAEEFGYGESTVKASFPAYCDPTFGLLVVLEATHLTGSEDWLHLFDMLKECPELWRTSSDIVRFETREAIEERLKKEKGEFFLEGQSKDSEIHPENLKEMREKGAIYFAYRNQDLCSEDVGELTFLQIGDGCTYKEAPRKLPASWQCTLEGEVDLTTGLIVKEKVNA